MVERIENLVTIDGVVNGTYMPSSKDRLLTDVVLREGFHIRGGLYANQLTIEGAGKIEGTIMAKKDILIYPPTENNAQKRIYICAGMSARQGISVQVPDTVSKTPVYEQGFIPLFIRGDVMADSVMIENAVVVGNIFARTATIKDSVIIGCPYIENKMIMRNSMALSFRAGSAELQNRNSLLIPYGLAESDISFPTYELNQEEKNQQKEFEAQTAGMKSSDYPRDHDKSWVRYMGLCRIKDIGCQLDYYWFHCPDHGSGTCKYYDVRMTEDDIIDFNKDGKRYKALTIAPRLVNLGNVKRDLDEMFLLVTKMLYFEHFSASSQLKIMEELKIIRGETDLPSHYNLLEEVALFDMGIEKQKNQ